MKIKIQQFLNANHSWSHVGKDIGRAFLKYGHEVHFLPTDKGNCFPKDLHSHVVKRPEPPYDLQLSYTAMHNFPVYLGYGNKNRFGIWNYESTIIPANLVKYINNCDLMLPSSNFSKEVFMKNKIPEKKMVVVPHGINKEEYASKEIYPLKTKARVKFCANIAQPHIRKNIPGLFEAWGKAFDKKDDVCLVMKVVIKNLKTAEKKQQFDVDYYKIFNKFKKKYPNHAEIEVVKDFLPSMVPLYNAVDVVFSLTFAECFWMPGLEGLATDNIILAPRYGGQLDFLNDKNSILIEGKVGRAPRALQYWAASPYAEVFVPDVDDAAEKMRHIYQHYDNLKEKFRPYMKDQVDRLTWGNVAKQILELTQ